MKKMQLWLVEGRVEWPTRGGVHGCARSVRFLAPSGAIALARAEEALMFGYGDDSRAVVRSLTLEFDTVLVPRAGRVVHRDVT